MCPGSLKESGICTEKAVLFSNFNLTSSDAFEEEWMNQEMYK